MSPQEGVEHIYIPTRKTQIDGEKKIRECSRSETPYKLENFIWQAGKVHPVFKRYTIGFSILHLGLAAVLDTSLFILFEPDTVLS